MDLMEIHDQYYERVNRFIVSLVKDQWAADDLIQETFIKVKNSLESVRDPEKLSSWIYRIAYNLCQDHFKAIKNEATIKEFVDIWYSEATWENLKKITIN